MPRIAWSPEAMRPARVLITTDAVGGVWRHALDLARSLNGAGIFCLLAGLGPPPADDAEARTLAPDTEMIWTGLGLDWMQPDGAAIDAVSTELACIARAADIDLLHLNLPSQAVRVPDEVPVVAMSHSCVATWWAAVRGEPVPSAHRWQQEATRRGLDRADAVLVPSRSHAEALLRAYGPVDRLGVLYNAQSEPPPAGPDRRLAVLAAGRWWDEGKNAAVLDRAAAPSRWPIELAGSLAGPDGTRCTLSHAIPLGSLPPDVLRQRMRSTAIFAAPSRYEPFGLAVLEAAANGAALVLADIPTFRELWHDAALFASPDEPGDWIDAFDRLAADDGLRAALADAAVERAAGFTPARQLQGLLGIYEDAMRHASRRQIRMH